MGSDPCFSDFKIYRYKINSTWEDIFKYLKSGLQKDVEILYNISTVILFC